MFFSSSLEISAFLHFFFTWLCYANGMISGFQLRVGVLLNFLAGVGLASVISVGVQIWICFVFALVVVFLICKNRIFAEWGMMFLAGLIGVLWLLFRSDSLQSDLFRSFAGREVELSGRILLVEEKYAFSELLVEIERFSGSDIVVSALKTRILVRDFFARNWEIGDLVRVKGEFTLPEDVQGGFYAGYLRMRGISGTVSGYTIEVLKKADFSLAGSFLKCRRVILARIAKLFPEPESAFLAGLLLGDRSGISTELKSSFQNAGLSHILAVSGYNVTLLLLFFSAVFAIFSPKIRSILGVLGVGLFVMLIGFDASAVRAGLMGIFGLLGLRFGRPKNIFWLILMCAFLMVAVNPLVLVYDIGFQLSFAATIGLVLLSRSFKTYFMFLGNFLSEVFSTTLAAQIATMPIVLYRFGYFSPAGLISNVLVVPLTSFATVGGVLILLFELMFGEDLARFLAWPELACLRLILWLVRFFG